ncbi:MAG: ABC transporter permease [Candidatus Kapabacteria bacterium]|nr:ABC transporter permease [Candidatus Kapabacteria bacterium]
MLTNYIKIALRALRRQKGYSVINIVGLALGISVCTLIALWVADELSFDRYHANVERIYRVDGDVKFQGQAFSLAVSPPPLVPTVKMEFPEIEDATRFRTNGTWNFTVDNKTFREEQVAYSDPAVFNVFSVPVIRGNGTQALTQPFSMVLTEEVAQKYFGNENPIGKSLKGDNNKMYTVGAVIKRFPSNSHIRFNVLISMVSYEDSKSNEWVSNNYNSYFLLKRGVQPEAVTKKFPDVIRKYIAPVLERDMHIPYDKFLKEGNLFRYYLFPLANIHLHSGNKLGEISPNGSMQYVWVFSGVAAFVLLIACVNFMNLSTARAANRAKEVGIRKTLGSQRGQLVAQFMAESSLMVMCALTLAFCIVEAVLTAFNDLAGKELLRATLLTPQFIGMISVLFVVVSLLAGAYPAFVLSAFQPVKVLKGDKSSGSKNKTLRSTLVVVQFTASVALVIGTLVIFNQLQFIQTKNLGFNREQILLVDDPVTLPDGSALRFRQEVSRITGVKNATVSNYLPTGGWRNNSILFTGKDNVSAAVQQWNVDADYVPTLGMEIVQGRNFSTAFASDSLGVIINQTAAKKFYGAENPLGKTVRTPNESKKEIYTVIGVVKDFHFESLRETIQPLVMFYGTKFGGTVIRFNAAETASVLAQVESTWKRLSPQKPFEYKFMDDSFREIYKSEQRIGAILGVFTALAIAIACLGLFGLAAFTAEQRTKEIGIRKVLGASVASIIGLLSKDFLKLVGIAIVVAVPLAWYGMSAWLRDFAYRVELSWWMFALAAAASVVIAFLTVAGQSWRAAQSNPVQSLRSE